MLYQNPDDDPITPEEANRREGGGVLPAGAPPPAPRGAPMAGNSLTMQDVNEGAAPPAGGAATPLPVNQAAGGMGDQYDSIGQVPGSTPATPDPGSFDRTNFRDSWMQTGRDVGAQDALLSKYGIKLDPAGRGRLPSGELLDLRIGAKAGQNQAGWTAVYDPQNPGSYPSGGGGGAGAMNALGGGGGGAGAGGNIPDVLRQQLLKLMTGADQPIDAAGTPQAQAFRQARLRGAQNERAAMAERAAFTGQNIAGQGSGAFDTSLQGINADASQDIAGNEGQVAQRELDARRGQLMQALQIADAMGARTEAAALQRELANLESQYRYAALGQNQGQFEDTQALNWSQLQQMMNRDALLNAMGG